LTSKDSCLDGANNNPTLGCNDAGNLSSGSWDSVNSRRNVSRIGFNVYAMSIVADTSRYKDMITRRYDHTRDKPINLRQSGSIVVSIDAFVNNLGFAKLLHRKTYSIADLEVLRGTIKQADISLVASVTTHGFALDGTNAVSRSNIALSPERNTLYSRKALVLAVGPTVVMGIQGRNTRGGRAKARRKTAMEKAVTVGIAHGGRLPTAERTDSRRRGQKEESE